MYSQTLLVAPTLRVSSPLSPLSVPSICISPAADATAHPDTPALEPSSPEDALSPRSVHLLPPPILSPLRHSLALSGKLMDKKGLDQSTFEDLLISNRERAAKRSVNVADRLRREVVVKAHHSKQFERRALFLSKIAAPPSPTSAETAVTPPESPAVFHFTLPSPGLASPLELFENVKARDSWVEQVDYSSNSTKRISSRLPSLDQITARLRPAVGVESQMPLVAQAPRQDEVKPRTSRLSGTILASARARSTPPPTPTIVIEAPAPMAVQREDEVKPRVSRLPDSIRASTRARSASPPTPTIVVTPIEPAPALTIAPAPAPASLPKLKAIKPVLVPQSIPALRINQTPSTELVPVPVMSWRDRAVPTPRKDVPVSRKESEPWRETTSWRDAQGHITSWRQPEREVPVRKEAVRHVGVPPISPRMTLPLPVGTKSVSAEGLTTSRWSALRKAQKEAADVVRLTESERRAVQGRNMLDKLRRRISAPAELEGSLRRGVPVGGF